MNIACFDALCHILETSIGAENFCSVDYLKRIQYKSSSIYFVYKKSTGDIIAGEIKVVITLRLIAAVSYLDLMLLWVISYGRTHDVFHVVLKYWIINDDVIWIEFNIDTTEIESMERTSKNFTSGRSNGIISGCTGVSHYWLVKIECPSRFMDSIRNVRSFSGRKGYYVINV